MVKGITISSFKKWQPAAMATLAAIWILVLIAAISMHLSDNQFISRDELYRNLSELQSYAQEGRYLAQYAKENKVSRKYVEAYAGSLQESTESIAEKLDEHPHATRLDEKVKNSMDLAETLSDNLQTISSAPQNEWPEGMVRQFADTNDNLSSLQESL